MRKHIRRFGTVLMLAVMVVGIAAGPASAATSKSKRPMLRLIAGSDYVEVGKFGDDPVYLDLGVVLGVDRAPLEFAARRFGKRISVGMKNAVSNLPLQRGPASVRMQDGLNGFFDVVVIGEDGNVVARQRAPFCPNGGERMRLRLETANHSRYPYSCGSPLTVGAVWGVDAGWGVSALTNVQVRLAEGTYDVVVSIARKFAPLFESLPAPVTVGMSVVRYDDSEPPIDPGVPIPPRPLNASNPLMRPGSAAFPVPRAPSVPGAQARPDLAALPAFNFTTEFDGERDRVNFAANVWNAGPAPLVVDGFRREGEMLMDAYQSFYAGAKRVGSVRTGELEFDRRDGHMHWHFKDFASYRLLSADRLEVLRSQKEAFCLAATDMIDVLLPGAALRPNSTGLETACGYERSLSIREVLDVGWGDTYYQSIPGQSFDVTDLPNGTYYVQVIANPDGNLYETTSANNVAYRKIELAGAPGARKVTAQPIPGLVEEFAEGPFH